MKKYDARKKFTGGENQDFEPWSIESNESK